MNYNLIFTGGIESINLKEIVIVLVLDNDLERVPALVGRHRGDEGRVRRKHPGQVEGRGGGRRLLRLRSMRPQQSDQVVQNF